MRADVHIGYYDVRNILNSGMQTIQTITKPARLCQKTLLFDVF